MTSLSKLFTWGCNGTASLYPGYFALVMATGIISNAMFMEDHRALSDLLLLVNLVAYPTLCLLTIGRLLFFRKALWKDMIDPSLVFAFFTIVAGSGVLGVGLNLRGFVAASTGLWVASLLLWFIFLYLAFGVLAFFNFEDGANVVHGGWLNAIVATESLVVLGVLIAPYTGEYYQSLMVILYMFWGIGLGLYGIFITLFAYRIFFFKFEPEDVTPLLWVVMGAAAIATNAGSVLILTDSGSDFLLSLLPFLKGMTLITWAWATWWMPILILFGIWKHFIRRVPISYTPMLWSLVFPLGMYTVASLRLADVAGFAPLRTMSLGMIWIAFGVWVLTSFGLLGTMWKSLRLHFRSV